MGVNHSQIAPGADAAAQLEALQKSQQTAAPEGAAMMEGAIQHRQSALVQQHKPLVRRTSSQRGYHPRSASLRRMRSIQRRRILEGSTASSSRPPARRTARMEAENKKRQDEKHLLAACARGDLKKVERLVDSGVDVNAADQSQMTALHYAAMHSRDEVIRSLIFRGAEVNTSDLKGGFTAMHWVVINSEPQYGSTDRQDKSLTALAKAGCRVNTTDFNFATPLHIAAQKGNKGCVQTLMRLGADPDKVDITGRNCYDVAKDEQTRALLNRLFEKYAQKKESPVYQVLEAPAPTMPAPPPSMPAPPPPIPPPRIVTARRTGSDEHLYEVPETRSRSPSHSPPSSPMSTTSSISAPPPPPRRRRQFSQDTHIYHVLEVPPPPRSRASRKQSPPRRRKARKN